MPIYEYSCAKCGDVIERIQKFSDPPLRKHEGCGGTLKKLVSQSAFQLKGEGWYVTDYARKGKDGSDGDSGSKEGGKESGATPEKGSGKGSEKGSEKSEKGAAKDSGSKTSGDGKSKPSS